MKSTTMLKSRKLFFPLIAALIALLVAAPLASSPTLTAPINALLSGMPADYPAVGDTWTYNMTVSPGDYTNVTMTVTGVVSIEDWNGTMVKCYNITQESSNSMDTENWMSMYVRTSDGAQIAAETYMLMNTSGTYMEQRMFSYSDVPVVAGFPYSVGKTWNQTVTLNYTGWTKTWFGPVPGWVNMTYDRSNATQLIFWQAGEVVNITEVTVPAGTFETWCIKFTSNASAPMIPILVRYEYYSPTVKNYVLLTNSTGDTGMELLSYSVSYPTREAIMTMMMFSLLYNQQQAAATMTYVYIGAGVVVVAAVAIGLILWRRRG